VQCFSCKQAAAAAAATTTAATTRALAECSDATSTAAASTAADFASDSSAIVAAGIAAAEAARLARQEAAIALKAAKQRENRMAILDERAEVPHARQHERDAYRAQNPDAVDRFRAEAAANQARQAQADREVHAVTF
jgi:hypothetical protein